jgi:hypothetical protein
MKPDNGPNKQDIRSFHQGNDIFNNDVQLQSSKVVLFII